MGCLSIATTGKVKISGMIKEQLIKDVFKNPFSVTSG